MRGGCCAAAKGEERKAGVARRSAGCGRCILAAVARDLSTVRIASIARHMIRFFLAAIHDTAHRKIHSRKNLRD